MAELRTAYRENPEVAVLPDVDLIADSAKKKVDDATRV